MKRAFSSVISTTNSPIGMVAAPISGYLEFYNFMLIIPKFNVIQKIYTPEGAADIKFWDWKMRNFSAGFIIFLSHGPFYRVVYAQLRKARMVCASPSKQFLYQL